MDLIEKINAEMCGNGVTFETPFGKRQITYADFTASGKPLEFIEDYISQNVLPMYSNTHTTSSVTGLQTTKFREDARILIGEATGADPKQDCVLFCGSGCTGAVSLLVNSLQLNRKSKRERAVIFVGPFEHHSNILPWKEANADIVMVPEDANRKVDVRRLEELLIKYRKRNLKIGSFSAASNVTGVQTDTVAIASLLHKYDALSFWDYASAAPYALMDMNPTRTGYKDAMFFSGHKFIGGPGSPGVLIIKNKLLSGNTPATPGGGTVLYVTENEHRYLDNTIERNEGGTPNIIGCIRLGLAFKLKQDVGTHLIEAREKYNTMYVMTELKENPNIIILGPKDNNRLPIISFMVKFGDLFLHHNFVCTLLNDLFGLQTRGGCQCAGPYSQRLLGISNKDAKRITKALKESSDPMIKPGFVRLSFPYFLLETDVKYIVKCLDFVGTHGWKFLSIYDCSHDEGSFTHSSGKKYNPTNVLEVDFLSMPSKQSKLKPNYHLRNSYLQEAHKMVIDLASCEKEGSKSSNKSTDFHTDLRWAAFECNIKKENANAFSSTERIVDPHRYDKISQSNYKKKGFMCRKHYNRRIESIESVIVGIRSYFLENK